MQIFIDSANINEIQEVHEWGFIAGVTTNPSLVAQEKRNYHEVLKEICALIDGPISAEVLSQDYNSMVEEAKIYADLHDNIVVKVPLTEDGLKAIKTLHEMRIKTNATLIFSPVQALIAARAGASFVSPFIGRVDDVGNDGLFLLKEIMDIFNQYTLDTQVIAASIRHPMHVIGAAKLGSDIATVPFKILKQIIKHPLTDAGIKKFMEDWDKVNKNGRV